MPPLDMRLQLQKRTPQGVPTDWVAVKLYYPFPNSIRITVNEKVITPIVLGVTTPPLNTSQCGSNIFYYFNYTIHFVVTGDPNCMVRVALTNSIQLTAHFTIDINKFYSNNLSTLLIDRMCALFRVVDTSQLKIVGIFAGSTIVTMFLDIPSNSTIANATQDSNNTAKDAQVVAMLQTIQ